MTSMHSSSETPAEKLIGVTLSNDWTVISRLARPENHTGGHFSVGYVVEHRTGRKGFLKAMDYSRAFQEPLERISSTINAISESILFEKNLLEVCAQRRLRRVVTAIDHGMYRIPGGSQFDVAEYLIFELADGDVRSQMSSVAEVEIAWKLAALHHIASALSQLHNNQIAHQDLKPSNVLSFPQDGFKVADLGRAACKGQTPPHDTFQVAGDLGYAPPEFLYGQIADEWNERRFGCDAYHLGSMIVYFFTGISMTGLLTHHTPKELRHSSWGGTYQDVLPYVLDAFSESLTIIEARLPVTIKADLSRAVRELCNPAPKRRGHPRERASRGNPYSLQRYVSLFDRLLRRINIG